MYSGERARVFLLVLHIGDVGGVIMLLISYEERPWRYLDTQTKITQRGELGETHRVMDGYSKRGGQARMVHEACMVLYPRSLH